MLREILFEILTSEPGFEVVSEGRDAAPDGDRPPDLAVTMIDGGVPAAYRELFRQHPGMRLLGLKAHGRDAFLVELQPLQVSLGELSSRGLAAVIRESAKRPDFASTLADM